MSNKCQITGKGQSTGHNVSHSQIKSKRKINANIQTKRLLNPANGQMMKIKLATSALKTLAKWQKAGKKYDLRELIK